MEIIFDCPHCGQELSVDSAGAGAEIKCPTCAETITIPTESTKAAPTTLPVEEEAPAPSLAPSAISSSAAAKVQLNLKVPVHSAPSASLIKKAAVPLEAIAKGADKKIRIRTMRHDKCIENGHDKFDEMVTKVLQDISEANIIGIHPISYEHFDVQTQKVMTDYGLVIVFRG
jgi:phage FluMu protein Com